nr:plastocyanin/azurin family copper-binding protein [Pontibaca salina]
MPGFALGADVVEIGMSGRPDGSKVWFDPLGVLIQPGQTVRWTNHDKGNSHTATAYAPENQGHPRRIPDGATPFDSDYLLPGESFETVLTVPGVYDYLCLPHEMAGMVGRIIVAAPEPGDLTGYPDGDLPKVVLDGFPSITEILKQKNVYRMGG